MVSDGGERTRHREQGEDDEQPQEGYETRGEVVESASDCEPECPQCRVDSVNDAGSSEPERTEHGHDAKAQVAAYEQHPAPEGVEQRL